MKKIILLGLASLMVSFYGQAQVKDISVTVAPTAEYTWWDSSTILDNSPFVGGRLGFGFGKYFEIRGMYMKSMDLKATLNDMNFNYAQNLAKDLKDNKVDIARWGGELKANIGFGGKIEPYLTLGTGVQTFEFDRKNQNLSTYEEKMVFASAGLGAKINLSDRIVLALEGKNTMFNMDENNPYLDPNLTPNGERERLYNWSAMASLEFYLGGRNPNELSRLDRAYMDSFRGGLKGFKFSLEPGGMYVDFDEKSPFSDSYFLGGAIGVDFNEYVGIRGFYYQATENRKLKAKLDNSMQIYGGNVIARLNNQTGVVPYLSLGGGYIDVADDYVNDEGVSVKDGSAFALGGLGLEIPFSKNILVFGSANYMMTAMESIDAQNIGKPSELMSNVAYRAGVRIQLGKKADDTKRLLNRRIQRSVDARETELDRRYQSEYDKLDASYKKEMGTMEAEYENRIAKLNDELEKAYQEDNVEKAVTILQERKRNENELAKVQEQQKTVQTNVTRTYQDDVIKMSRAEFEKLVNEIIQKIDNKQVAPTITNEQLKGLSDEATIKNLENALVELNKKDNQQYLNNQTTASDDVNLEVLNNKILSELSRLSKQVEKNSDLITRAMIANAGQTQPTTLLVDANKGETKQTITRTVDSSDGTMQIVETKRTFGKKWANQGFAVYTGPNFGSEFTWNVGLRSYHSVGNSTKIKFMPEVYFGVGSETGFGLSGNFIYTFNFTKGKFMNPYVGLGLGFFKQGESKFGPNVIIGTEVNILKGKVFVDYSARNPFKNNQVAVGYRFTF